MGLGARRPGMSTGEAPQVSRTRATLAVLPFLALGLADVLLIVGWGLDPLWGLLVLPPILFISVLGWVAFKHGFVRDAGA